MPAPVWNFPVPVVAVLTETANGRRSQSYMISSDQPFFKKITRRFFSFA
jgi:hypothetical protein